MGRRSGKPWVIRPDVAELYAERAARLKETVARRRKEFDLWAQRNPELAAHLRDCRAS